MKTRNETFHAFLVLAITAMLGLLAFGSLHTMQ